MKTAVGVTMSLHQAKEVIMKVGVIKALLQNENIPDTKKKQVFDNIDAVRSILLEAQLQEV